MKKVVRLTEQDLVRLVKRVLNEQANGGASWEKIVRACSNTFGTDLRLLKIACGEINNQETYNQALAAAKKKNYQTIMSYIMGDFSTIFDSVKYSPASAGKGDYGADGWSKDNDTQTALFCDTQLRKFNPKEHEAFMDKVETPYG